MTQDAERFVVCLRAFTKSHNINLEKMAISSSRPPLTSALPPNPKVNAVHYFTKKTSDIVNPRRLESDPPSLLQLPKLHPISSQPRRP